MNESTRRLTVSKMSVAITMAQALDRRARDRISPVPAARRDLASKLRIGLGTLNNLVRGRVKSIDADIRDRLEEMFVNETKAEIARLQHELDAALQGRSRFNPHQIRQIETHLRDARSILRDAGARA